MTLADILRKSPEARAALEESVDRAISRGVKITLAVHSYLTPQEIQLGSQGKIEIRYSPQEPRAEWGASERDVVIIDGNNQTMYKNWPFLAAALGSDIARGSGGRESDIQGRALPNYPVPPEKVEEFAEMLNKGKKPEDIVAYLRA